MQERRYDGTDELTENAIMEQFNRAMHDPRNRSVELHKPGSIITTMEKGHRRKYLVEANGDLTRVHLRTHQPIRNPV